MKRQVEILIIGLTLGLFACNLSMDKQGKNIVKHETVDSVALTNIKMTKTATEQDQTNDCVRRQVEPIIQKEYYPNTIFVLQPHSLMRIKTIIFDNEDKFAIGVVNSIF
jgi:hypothetical protein